jgi:hypothetical protein
VARVRLPVSTEEDMRVRRQQHGSWLFPLMVVTAATVVAFGALGLAMVTGHLRGKPASGGGDNLVTAEANGPVKAATGKAEGAAGLTATVEHN